MKRLAWIGTLALTVALVGVALAQTEVMMVPDETVQQVAPKVIAALSQNFPNAPLKIDGVAEKTVAYHSGDSPALLLMPDRGFTAKTVADAGEKTAPAGVLALRGLVPVLEGKRLPSEKLAKLAPDGNAHDVGVLFLGVKKGTNGNPVLEAYSADPKPLLEVSLARKTTKEEGMRPLTAEFANLDRTAKQADMVITLDGTYEATLRIASPE